MKRQAWQDLRLRFVISHSLVAGQLYSIFPAIKQRDGHPETMFSPLSRDMLYCRDIPIAISLYMLYVCSLVCTYILWDHSYMMMALESPALLIRTHFRKKLLSVGKKPGHPRGWLQSWAFRCNVSSRHIAPPLYPGLFPEVHGWEWEQFRH